MSRENLIEKIKEQITCLYFLNPKIMEGILQNINKFPEEALNSIKNLLEEAKKKQNDVLMKLNSKNKNFNQELKEFLNKNYTNATNIVTEKEHEDAEKLLNDM